MTNRSYDVCDGWLNKRIEPVTFKISVSSFWS